MNKGEGSRGVEVGGRGIVASQGKVQKKGTYSAMPGLSVGKSYSEVSTVFQSFWGLDEQGPFPIFRERREGPG